MALANVSMVQLTCGVSAVGVYRRHVSPLHAAWHLLHGTPCSITSLYSPACRLHVHPNTSTPMRRPSTPPLPPCPPEILGQFQAERAARGQPPVQVLTKYVPNIFQQRVTPAAVEAAVQRSLNNLQVGVGVAGAAGAGACAGLLPCSMPAGCVLC